MQTKKCPKCLEPKPSDQYGINRNSPDGYGYYCKLCAAQRRKENRDFRGLKAWVEKYVDQCARCGFGPDVLHLWLQDSMIPVTICEPCHQEYDYKVSEEPLTIDEFYAWLRKKMCASCGHEWLARSPKPLLCPKCMSRFWEYQEKEL